MKQLKYYYGKEDGETHGDLNWIRERIGLTPICMQSEIAERYSYIYFKLQSEGEKGHRRRANIWLRKTTEKNKCQNTGGYF